jgi:large subunit ribosomal protein L13
LDLGDYVVLTNARFISFTGKKLTNEYYYNHSGHPGGMRQRSLKIMIDNYPTELIQRIIKGMMPHTKLVRKQLKRLFIYPDSSHPHQAQEKNFIEISLEKIHKS